MPIFFEDDVIEKLTIPYIFFPQNNLEQKKNLAIYIYNLDSELLLIPSRFAFSYPAFLSGLSEKHIEYFAKNAPVDYKKELFSSIQKEYIVKEMIEIAKVMDKDLGDNINKNQSRIKNNIQYIKDNRIVFEF